MEWILRTSAADNDWFSVAYGVVNGKGLFVAVSLDGSGTRVMTSPDGIKWALRNSAADNTWISVTHGVVNGSGLFVAVSVSGTGNRVMTSSDGINWTSRSSAADNSWYGVTHGVVNGNGLFVAVAASGTGNRVMTSPDGITWTSRSSAADNSWHGVTHGVVNGSGLFVAVSASGTGNRVMTSPDGINWTIRTSAPNSYWYDVTWGSEHFVAVALGGGPQVMTSIDGVNWEAGVSASTNPWVAVSHGEVNGKGLFVAVSTSGTGNRVMSSLDGITWVSEDSAADNGWRGLAYGEVNGKGLFVAVAYSGTGNRVMTSLLNFWASEDYITAATANYRDPRARVKVTWLDSVTDSVLVATADDSNRASRLSQTHDGTLVSSQKWAYCSTGNGTNELVANGDFKVMPSNASAGQVGWFNAIASDSNGEWIADPLLVFTFTTRAFKGDTIAIQCDTKYTECPTDFTLRLYKDAVLLHTAAVTGNTDVAIEVALENINEAEVNKLTLEINKWNTPYGIVKIIEVDFALQDVYYGDDIISLEVLEETEVEEGSIPIGNISSNEINLTLSNEDNRFSFGNTNSPYNGVLKKERKVEVWFGFVLPAGSDDVTIDAYIVEIRDGVKVGYIPYGVYWSDEWITDTQSMSVNTFARDRLDSLRQLIYEDSLLSTDITLYDLAEKVMLSADSKMTDNMSWFINDALEGLTVPFGFFDKKTYFEALKDIAVAGLSTVYVNRVGTIIIGAYPVIPSGSLAQEATWTHGVIYSQTVSPKTEEVANHITVRAKHLALTPSAVSIYESDEQYTIPSGESELDIVLTWDNVPVSPSTVVITLTDVSGTSVIATEKSYVWGGQLTISGSAGNVFTIGAVGVAAIAQSELEYATSDGDSIVEYGKKVFEFPDNHLIQRYSVAKLIGDGLLPTYKAIRKDASVSLPANTLVGLSDPVLLTEYKDDLIETNSYFYVIRQTLTFDGSLDSNAELRRFLT